MALCKCLACHPLIVKSTPKLEKYFATLVVLWQRSESRIWISFSRRTIKRAFQAYRVVVSAPVAIRKLLCAHIPEGCSDWLPSASNWAWVTITPYQPVCPWIPKLGLISWSKWSFYDLYKERCLDHRRSVIFLLQTKTEAKFRFQGRNRRSAKCGNKGKRSV